MILSLIPLGSAVAFNVLVSLSSAGLYFSYLLVCSLVLWRRLTGAIKPHSDENLYVGPGNLSWGPWKLPGRLGIANNIFACIYLTFLLFWIFWPAAIPVTAQTMNFSVLMLGGVVILSTLWFVITGRKHFSGPVQEVWLGDR
jgi:choline transport protein